MVPRLGRRGAGELVRVPLQSSREFVQERFHSRTVQTSFVARGLNLDFGQATVSGAILPFLAPVLDHRNGMAIVRGG